MFELWAKRKDSLIYDYILTFVDKKQKFYYLDRLNEDIYSEAVLLEIFQHNANKHNQETKAKILKKK